MKSILLTTTAIVAFAGAAAADGHAGIGFAGEATLGYNDDIEDGFYWSSDVDVTMTAGLDNGVTAEATFGLNVVDDSLSDEVVTSDFVLKLSTDGAALSFGDVDPVAEANWGGVDGDSVAGFNDQDVHFDVAGFEAMLVGEATVGGVDAKISYGVDADGATAEDDVDALQVYASGDFGVASVEVAYQQEFAGTPQIFGIAGTASAAGAEITLAYIDDETESSFGIGVSYPAGPVTLGAYYSVNDPSEDAYGVSADYADGPISVSAFYDFAGGATDADADDSSEVGVEGSYDVGNGLTLLAGYISTTAGDADATGAYYVAGTYDLGGGAELLISYAEDEANEANDEIGDPEYMHGTTVEVSFSF